jgi:hypothetical protein
LLPVTSAGVENRAIMDSERGDQGIDLMLQGRLDLIIGRAPAATIRHGFGKSVGGQWPPAADDYRT